MSGFSGINQFGSLTTQAGQRLKFEDFDLDKNGEISKEEYESVMKEMKLDSVELSTVDKNGDETISEDEFAIWEQKQEMQNAVNDLAAKISKDFSGDKAKYIPEVTTALKDLIDDYAKNFTGEISKMADAFKGSLPAKYEAIKAETLANDPTTVKSQVLDEIYNSLTTPVTTKNADGTETTSDALPAATAKRIGKELEAEADKFIKGYKGDNLAADLQAHLEEFINKSDAEKLSAEAEAFRAGAESFGAFIDSGELKELKEYAKEFLQAAVDKGITIRLGGVTIKTTAAITTALNKFTDGDELKAAMEDAINALGTVSKKEEIIAEEKAKAAEEAEKKFTDIKGSEYAIDGNMIDYTSIPGYAANSQFNTKGKDGHDSNLRQQARDAINNSSLKEQFRAQITKMLEAKGVPFDKIATIFENVYNDSLNSTLADITSRKTNNRIMDKKKTYATNQGIQEIVQNFIAKFNTNIAQAIDDMNASNVDMDLQDLDYTALTKEEVPTDESGNPINPEETPETSVLSTFGSNSKGKIDENADKLCDRMKAQLLKKANNMCKANGIAFDNTAFTTIFNNAKMNAKNAGVENFFFNVAHINTSKLIDTLTNEFKTNFTAWVEKQKTQQS